MKSEAYKKREEELKVGYEDFLKTKERTGMEEILAKRNWFRKSRRF